MPTYLVHLTQTIERTYRIESRDPDAAMRAAQEHAEENGPHAPLIRERCGDAVSWELDGGAHGVTNGARG